MPNLLTLLILNHLQLICAPGDGRTVILIGVDYGLQYNSKTLHVLLDDVVMDSPLVHTESLRVVV